jgi:branched-chain amino acid aminotransferase
MKQPAYFNGKIMPVGKIKLSPYDLGVLRGYGVFDVMCTKNGKPLHLPDHWKRLVNSARELQLKIPVSRKEFENVVKKLIRLNGYSESTIRTVLTGGISSDAFSIGRETFYIMIEKFKPLSNEIFQKGAKVMTLEYQRHHPRAKITNYVMAIKNLKRKKQLGALEIIYIKNGKALEASTSNFFIVKKKKLITPVEDILHGITRKIVIDLAKKQKIPVIQRKVTAKEMLSSDEIFLSASNKDIVPIIQVDNKKIGSGKPGPVTRYLLKAFQDFSKCY